MIFKLWLIGIVVTIATAIKTRLDYNPNSILNYFLITFCIITVGGITDALLVTLGIELLKGGFIFFAILFILLTVCLTYLLGYFILGLDQLDIPKICFIVIFIISIIAWTLPLYHQLGNIETTTETEVAIEERQLISFCQVPVQNVSGTVNGHSFLGSGNVYGTVYTLQELPYCYIDELGEGAFDLAPSADSKLIFFNDDTIPYVEIITHITKSKHINHNEGTESTLITGESKEYKFYLPEDWKQFNF